MSKVSVRKRKLKNGRESFLLDYSPPLKNPANGKPQRFEFLQLFVYTKPANRLERQHNSETITLVENIRAQRQLDIQSRRFGFKTDRDRSANFIEYFQQFARSKQKSTSDNHAMAFRYFVAFIGHDLSFHETDEFLITDYKNFLLSGPGISRRGTPIKRNTAVSYFAKLRTCLKRAYKQKLIEEDLYSFVDPITPKDTNREQLEIEEFQQLANTPVKAMLIKRAAIFAGLTGLRFSDVQTLLWSEVRGTPGKYLLQFTQEKTEGAEILPISDQAVDLLGVKGDPDSRVFKGLKYNQMRACFKIWLKDAGITKNITFHSFRHTYATLQLEFGTELYTVSKLLGHRNVKTTQIYTKVKDKKKVEAASRITLDLPWLAKTY